MHSEDMMYIRAVIDGTTSKPSSRKNSVSGEPSSSRRGSAAGKAAQKDKKSYLFSNFKVWGQGPTGAMPSYASRM